MFEQLRDCNSKNELNLTSIPLQAEHFTFIATSIVHLKHLTFIRFHNVGMTSDSLVEICNAVKQIPNCTKLSLSDNLCKKNASSNEISTLGIQAMAQCKKLQSLVLQVCNINSKESIAKLAATLTQLNNLQELHLYGNYLSSNFAVICDSLSSTPNLNVLDLECCSLNSNDCTQLAIKIKVLNKLKY